MGKTIKILNQMFFWLNTFIKVFEYASCLQGERENALNAMPNQDHCCETQPLSSGFPF